MKCKYLDIKDIMDWCEKYGKQYDEKMYSLIGTQPSCYEIAYYTPSQANWSYRIELLMVDNILYKVVTVFGEIRAIMPVQLHNNNYDEMNDKRFWYNK